MKLTETGNTIRKWICIYLTTVTYVVVPLYMKNGYFGLIEAKAGIYRYFAMPAIAAALLLEAALLAGKRKNGPGKMPEVSTLLLILTGVWALISSGLSYSFKISALGVSGWSVGSLMTVLLITGTIYIARNLRYENSITLTMIAANVFIIMLAVVQSAGRDPFYLLKDLIPEQYFDYLSTIGNANSFSGYLCLILPIFWGGFMLCKNRFSKILYGVICVIGFLGAILANCDSFYAGIGICLIFMILFIFGSEQYVKRSSVLLFSYGCCLLFVRYLPAFSEKTDHFMGVSKAMLEPPAAEILCLCGIALYFLGWKIIGGKWNRPALAAVEAVILLVICFFVMYSVRHFDDAWGSGRGAIWRVGWEQFRQFSFRKKMVGIGPEMLFIVYAKLRVDTGRNVVSAHCEPLQVLLTQGIAGLSLYAAFWGYLLRLFFKKRLWRESTAVFFFPLAAYWGQSLFCSVYPITAVVFSFAAGVYLSFTEERSDVDSVAGIL